ncbi:MAG: hypothetical protein R2806_16170 [Saprospiraceae bacterium]
MTKSEKRFFKVFVNRNNASEDTLFIQLFDVIDRMKMYDEESILTKIPGIKKAQLSNLKAHLYKQLLVSLRLLHRNQLADIDMRERLDYARVLYSKGLYRQSLEILDKLKKKAEVRNQYTIALEILEFEKLIESQYITRSMADRAEELTREAIDLAVKVKRAHEFSNLSLLLYGLYLKVGYVRNEKDYHFVKQFFESHLPSYQLSNLDFFEKLYLYQSYVWYYYMTQEFTMYFRYAQKWVDLFHDYPEMIDIDMPLYLKGLHNLLNAHFLTGQHHRLMDALREMEDLLHHKNLDKNMESLLTQFLFTHQISKHYLEGSFTEGIELAKRLASLIDENPYNWDSHRVMVFYYRIACLYFGSGNPSMAITYLNRIINEITPDFREDIQGFARILNLISHFELGNDQLVEYQVKSVYRFLSKMEDLNKVQVAIIKFIRNLTRILPAELKQEMIRLREKLIKLEHDPYERRPFLYLDIISWLDSKIEGVPVQEVIQRKFRLKQKMIAERSVSS